MKKILCVFAIFLFLTAPFSALAYESESYDDFALFTSAAADVLQTAADAALSLSAASAILIERQTGQVLYEKNADDSRAIASITKVMTLLLTMEALESGKLKLTDEVCTSAHAASMGGSQIWLEPGEVMTVDQLLKAVCVQSANDAAVALAEAVSGSEEGFVALMNEKAKSLGMTNTSFKNANGLDEAGHLSCARDVAIMSNELLNHPLIRNYCTIWMDELRGGATQLTNTNKLLKSYNGITGLKTGTTGKAGVCISASAERDGMELIAVVLGCPDSKSRFNDARKLLDFGFANYEMAALSLPQDAFCEIRVTNGERQNCPYTLPQLSSVLVRKGQGSAVRCEVVMEQAVEAPVLMGQQVGVINVMCEGEKLFCIPIEASEEIPRLTFKKALTSLFRAMVCAGSFLP